MSAINWLIPSLPAVAQSPASLSLQWTNDFSRLSVSGATSNACTLQYATNLTTLNPWHFLTYSLATNDPARFLDTNQYPSGSCFYRVFTQQLPTNVAPTTKMIWISPGTFTMGSPTNEALRGSDETQHIATLSHGFFMGEYPVTQGDYLAMTTTNPSFYNTNNPSHLYTNFAYNLTRPVEEVSWLDATN